MNRSIFWKVLLTTGIVAVVSTLFLGINAAFGIPTEEPPSTDISPTFNGLTTTGEVHLNDDVVQVLDEGLAVSGQIDVRPVGATQDSFYVDENGDMSIRETFTAHGRITANDGITATGAILGSTQVTDLTATDTIVAENDVEVTGFVTASMDVTARNLIANNDLTVDGNTTMGTLGSPGDLTVYGAGTILGAGVIEGGLEVGGLLDASNADIHTLTTSNLTAHTLDTTANITALNLVSEYQTTVNSDLTVENKVYADEFWVNNGSKFLFQSSDLECTHNIKGNNLTAGNYLYTNHIDVVGSGSQVTIQDDAQIKGYATIDGYVTASTGMRIKDTLKVDSIENDNLSTITFNDNVDINGSLKANSFGTYYYRDANKTVAAGVSSSISKACNSGEILISCGGFGSNVSKWTIGGIRIYNGTTCYVYGKNNDSISRALYVNARCLDPDA